MHSSGCALTDVSFVSPGGGRISLCASRDLECYLVANFHSEFVLAHQKVTMLYQVLVFIKKKKKSSKEFGLLYKTEKTQL